MKKKIEIAVSIVLFVALLVTSLSVFSSVFTPKRISRIATVQLWNEYYNEPENTIDVLFVGPSTLYYGLSPTELYDNFGFTSYNLSSPKQTSMFSWLYLDEALKTQNPKLVVLDQTLFFEADYDEFESFYRTTMDHLRNSINKCWVASQIVSESGDQSFLSYVFPLLRYHGRWTELTEEDIHFNEPTNYVTKGFSTASDRAGADLTGYYPIWEETTSEVDADFDKSGLTYFLKIVELCNEKGIDLLVAKMPVVEKSYTYARHNGVAELCDSLGLVYLDLNTEEHWTAMGIDKSYDFNNPVHLNLTGSDKATVYLGNYLVSNYELPDHREEDGFEEWDVDVLKTRLEIASWIDEASDGIARNSLALAMYCDAKTVMVEWPVTSYVENVDLYREDENGRELLSENDLSGAYHVENPVRGSTYVLVYQLKGIDEPYEISFEVTENEAGLK